MCRSIEQGGRRCPCGQPERRAAYRRALKARRKAESMLQVSVTVSETPTGGSGYTSGGLSASVDELGDPGTPTNTATDLVELTGVNAEAGLTPQERYATFESVKELLASPDRDKVIEEFGGEVNFTTHIGSVIAGEAMARAGINVEEVPALNQQYKDDLNRRRKELNAEQDAALDTIAELRAAAEDRLDPYARMNPKEVREAAKNEPEVVAAREHYEKLFNEHEAVMNEIMRGGDYGRETMKKASDAYMEVLQEVRPFGGDHDWHPSSPKKDVNTFNNALRHYPSDWIMASAKEDYKPKVKTTKVRAHYKARAKQISRKKIPVTTIIGRNDRPSPSIIPMLNADGTPVLQEVTGPGGVGVQMAPVGQLATVRITLVSAECTDEYMKTIKPAGKGWSLYRDENVVCWRRPMEEYQTRIYSAPELLTTDNKWETMPGVTDRDSKAVHELAHRFEHVNPKIKDLEDEYLRSRLTKDDRLEPIYETFEEDDEKEVGYRDHFLHHYMGKVYEDGSREIMSMGMEGLFGGQSGGLIGLSNDGKADTGMRDFVLGTLAWR